MDKFKGPPKRKYATGEKKMVSMRIPSDLMKELEKISNNLNWTVTDIIVTALNDYVEWERQKSSKK